MSDLEKQAKTSEEIGVLSAQAEVDVQYKNLNWKERDKIKNQKWVPFEVAQKLEKERNAIMNVSQDFFDKKERLQKQIDEVQKLLNQFPLKRNRGLPDKMGIIKYDSDEVDVWRAKLQILLTHWKIDFAKCKAHINIIKKKKVVEMFVIEEWRKSGIT